MCEKDRNVCFHCGGRLVWQNDFSYEDYGYEGEGIVQVLNCMDCGADVEYKIGLGEDEDEN